MVYVAVGTNFADALAAGAASGGDGPVLLSQSSSIDATTLAELRRLAPKRIVVLGGTAAIGSSVFEEVRAIAPTTRVGGADRYATAAQLSAANFAAGVPVVYVATGTGFADALSAGGAAQGLGPILLVQPNAIPSSTATELQRLTPQRIVVLGGTSAVSASVQSELALYTAGSVSRLGGADRYATSAAISASTFATGVARAFLATGTGYADALAAAALGAPVLLTRPDCVPQVVLNEITRLDAGELVVIGGTSAVSDAVRRLTACS